VVIIEHNLDVIRNGDWILDLGPEGGENGGRLVAEGRPAKVAATEESFTGQFLRRYYKAVGGQLAEIELEEDAADLRMNLAVVAGGKFPCASDDGGAGARVGQAKKRAPAKKTPKKSAGRKKPVKA
jgi:excinuclease ABC subunit A